MTFPTSTPLETIVIDLISVIKYLGLRVSLVFGAGLFIHLEMEASYRADGNVLIRVTLLHEHADLQHIMSLVAMYWGKHTHILLVSLRVYKHNTPSSLGTATHHILPGLPSTR